jgi:hypothetical protein
MVVTTRKSTSRQGHCWHKPWCWLSKVVPSIKHMVVVNPSAVTNRQAGAMLGMKPSSYCLRGCPVSGICKHCLLKCRNSQLFTANNTAREHELLQALQGACRKYYNPSGQVFARLPLPLALRLGMSSSVCFNSCPHSCPWGSQHRVACQVERCQGCLGIRQHRRASLPRHLPGVAEAEVLWVRPAAQSRQQSRFNGCAPCNQSRQWRLNQGHASHAAQLIAILSTDSAKPPATCSAAYRDVRAHNNQPRTADTFPFRNRHRHAHTHAHMCAQCKGHVECCSTLYADALVHTYNKHSLVVGVVVLPLHLDAPPG